MLPLRPIELYWGNELERQDQGSGERFDPEGLDS
jgi:hypothetical protein